ncbi:MAG: T9SS type A sorting domain-containing protein [Flavobacterium sp.]|uniref:T9SS type A sorting domain-containing protein n=1 Tax=Flavobacterium sp. TaxID=239 RepID=UPI0022BBD5BF|nr:T9SS type A sorting domain-containing protein [Flavobacterium sp.]MCZ8332342.1 T9SS type A sorting domain-containing protein [Flavobacterium sp.]
MKIRLQLFIFLLVTTNTIIAQCYSKIVSYNRQYYALQTDGTLWYKGFNFQNYFGLGHSNVIPDFVQFGTDNDWTNQIAQSGSFTLAIKTDGTLWAWGKVISPASGIETTSEEFQQPIQVGNENNWAKIVTSGLHTLAIKTDGTLWVWGNNDGGRFGIPSFPINVNTSTPLQVGTDNDWQEVFTCLWSRISCAIKTNGTLWTWGGNGVRIGYSNATINDAYRSPHQIGTDTWKTAVVGGSGGSPSSVTFGIKTDGTLWCWGATGGLTGTYFFGNGIEHYSSEIPEQIGTANDWEKIASSDYTTVGLKTNGTCWGWGKNSNYQLGLGQGNNTNVGFPTQMGTDNDWETITLVDGVYTSFLGIKNNNSIYYSGLNHLNTLATTSALLSESTCDLSINEYDKTLFTAYPNPFTDSITFQINEPINDFELQIINQLGQVIYKKHNSNSQVNFSIDTSLLTQGIYYATISNNKTNYTVKLFKH